MAAKPLFIMNPNNPNTSHGLSSMMPAGEASQVKGASHQHQPGLSGDSPAGMPPVIHGSLLAANDAIAVRQGLPGARRPGRNGQDEDDRACRDEERDEQGNPVQHADGRDDDDSCAALLAAPAGEGAAASSAGSTGAAAAMGATGAAGIASTTGGSGAAAAGTAGAATGISPSAAALTQTLLMGGAVALGGFGGSDSTASDSRSANGSRGNNTPTINNDTPSIDPGSTQNPGGNAQNPGNTPSPVPSTGTDDALPVRPAEPPAHVSPAAPEYTTNPLAHVGHDQVTPLKAQLFTGNDDSLKPAAVRIDKIQATNADGSVSEQGTPALLLDPDGDGPKEATLVSEGQRISADDFGKLRWDAHGSDGGRLAFTPVDADGVAYGTTQQVTIFEQPLPPVYAQDIDPIQAGFQKMVNLSDHLSTIIGSDATRAPSAIRIDELTAPHPQDGAQTPLFLKNDDGSLTPVTAGDGHNVIQAADFSRLVWDASKSDGGWFIFEALDAQGEPFPNATGQHLAHRVQIDEDAVAGHTRDSEDYVANNVANDSITWLTPNAYGPAPETLRFFRLGDITAWESGGQTRIVMDAATSPDGKEAAYEIIRHAGLTLEEAQAQAAARGAKLLTIDSQQELDWLQKQVTDGRFGIHNEPDKGTDDTDLSGYVYTSRLGTADGTPEAQGSNAKGFIIEYNDYKSPLRLHSATDSGKFEYLHTGDVLSNHDMQRLTWDSHQNNGGKIWLVELEPQADDPTKASDKTTGEWIGWGFEERDRLGTYGTWEEVHNRLGVRSVSATSQEAPSATTQADADTHAAVDASQLNLWKGTSALLDDLQHASLALI